MAAAFCTAYPFIQFRTSANSSSTRRRLVSCVSSPPPARETLIALTAPEEARVGRDEQLAPLLAELTRLPSPQVDRRLIGVWRNAHTSVPDTASPIQRAFLRNDAIVPRVLQIVVGEDKPVAVVNRVSLPLGVLNLLGVVTDVEKERLRIRFARAWFSFPGGIRFPYPVPFRLLGQKACGWLDVLYVDEELRIAKGNRGSTFVLRRERNVDAISPDVEEELNSALRQT